MRSVANELDTVQMPKWKWTFDLYADSDVLSEGSSYVIISREWQKTRGKSNLGRLRLYKLGVRSDVKHLLSEKNRTLYIGRIPESQP